MAASMNIFFVFFLFNFMPFSECSRKDIFSTKTAYSWIYDIDQNVDKNELMTTKYNEKHCVAVNAQVMLRHGSRYPGYKDIRKMNNLHKKLKLVVRSPDYDFLRSWENDFPESEEKQLVDEGEEEHYALGQRFGKRLFDLFQESLDSVEFISSSKERCIDSAMAFYEGITETVLHEAYDDLDPKIDDNILRFHEICNNYHDAVENNRTQMIHHKKFKIQKEMKAVAESLRRRLGIEHAEIDAGELKLIYFWCTFETIILEQDHWCNLLTDEEKEVIEYHNDLKQYWKKAYGHQIIGNMACPLVKAMFTVLDKTIEDRIQNRTPRGNRAKFYFGHTETLAPLYAALGLFNDSTPLTDTNFNDMKSRVFKSSKILPFSANLALVLYKCNYEEEPVPNVEDFVVQFFVNEQSIKIPVCDDYLCSYKMVRDTYAKHIDQCNFEETCGIKKKHDEL
ncbi:hypothetical protein ACF0H5_000326 [Mactra antiquata]